MTDDYLGPEPTRDETAEDEAGKWLSAVVSQKARANRYEAALRKIAGWQREPANPYANEMLETLRQVAEEALA